MDTDCRLRHAGLDDHGVGTVFEELIRRFTKENNEEERSAVVDARGAGEGGDGERRREDDQPRGGARAR